MAIFKNRLASMQDLVLVFLMCAFPIFIWSIFHVLNEVPAWVLRLSSWDLIGIIAYTQLFALIESVLVFLAVVILAAILPAHLFRDKFVAQGSVLMLLTSAWAMLAHNNSQIFGPEHLKQLVLWFGVYLVSIGIGYGVVHRYTKVQELIRSFGNRVTVLSTVYVAVGLISTIIVIIRNV